MEKVSQDQLGADGQVLQEEADQAGMRALPLEVQVQMIAYESVGGYLLDEMINHVAQECELEYPIEVERKRLEEILRYIRRGEREDVILREADITLQLSYFDTAVRKAQRENRL